MRARASRGSEVMGAEAIREAIRFIPQRSLAGRGSAARGAAARGETRGACVRAIGRVRWREVTWSCVDDARWSGEWMRGARMG